MNQINMAANERLRANLMRHPANTAASSTALEQYVASMRMRRYTAAQRANYLQMCELMKRASANEPR